MRQGSEWFAQMCVQMVMDLSDVDLHKQTPSCYAASRRNRTMVRFLLNSGFELIFQDERNDVAFF